MQRDDGMDDCQQPVERALSSAKWDGVRERLLRLLILAKVTRLAAPFRWQPPDY